jgi:hypothetical protein
MDKKPKMFDFRQEPVKKGLDAVRVLSRPWGCKKEDSVYQEHREKPRGSAYRQLRKFCRWGRIKKNCEKVNSRAEILDFFKLSNCEENLKFLPSAPAPTRFGCAIVDVASRLKYIIATLGYLRAKYCRPFIIGPAAVTCQIRKRSLPKLLPQFPLVSTLILS